MVWGSLSELLRGLRERSGLTQQQLADQAALPVAEVVEFESGAADPTYEVVRRFVTAAGNEVTLLVTPHRESEQDRWIRRQLHNAISQLFVATETLEEKEVTQEQLSIASYVCLGLFGAARQLLHALLILDRSGEGGLAGPNLVRQVLEYVATAFWISEEAEQRAVAIYQETNRSLRELARLDEWWRQRLEDRQRLWTEAGVPDQQFIARLPRVDERLVGPMSDWYVRYRDLSIHSHPTMFVVEDALGVEPPLRFQSGTLCDLGWFAMAGCLVWSLALSLEHGQGEGTEQRRTELGYRGDQKAFAELGIMLNSFTNEPGLENWRSLHASASGDSPQPG